MSANSLHNEFSDLAPLIHQAALNPHFDKEMLVKVCDASRQHGFAGLCTSLSLLPIVRERLGSKSTTKLVAVIAFPFGFIPNSNKLKETLRTC